MRNQTLYNVVYRTLHDRRWHIAFWYLDKQQAQRNAEAVQSAGYEAKLRRAA